MGWIGTGTGRAPFGVAGALALIVGCGGLAGCGEDGGPSSEPQDAEGTGETSAASAPFAEPSVDVGAVMRQVHFAFRPDGEGRFVGGDSTYAASVQEGRLRVVPRHHVSSGEGSDDPLAELTDRRVPGEPAEVVEGRALELETMAVERGGRSLLDASVDARVDDDGSLRIDRGTVVERLRNGESGVEQSWELENDPGGEGDLVVRVATAGLRPVDATRSGLHFADPSTGLGFRYGHALWIDAEGDRVRIPARRQGREIVLEVPHEVVADAAFPAVLDPTVSPEIGTDQPVEGPSIFGQGAPSVAYDGASWLVVWADYRPPSATGEADIYGARVAPDGTVLDPLGIPLALVAGDQQSPRVESTGDGWLVVWEDFRNEASSGVDVYGARVAADGTVVDAGGFPIESRADHDVEPDVATDGVGYLVVFRSGGDVRGVRLDATGTILDAPSFAISTAADVQWYPTVAFNGSGYLVTWTDARNGGSSDYDVYAARVGTDGSVADPSGIPIATNVGSHQAISTVASAGSDYVVAWQDQRDQPTNGWDAYAARVATDGTVTDPGGFVISALASDEVEPVVASNGSGYLVTWDDGRNGCDGPCDVYAARLGTDGSVLDSTGIPVVTVTGLQGNSWVASDGTDYFAVWQDARDEALVGTEVYGARIGADGTVADPDGFRISGEANVQSFPAVATDGSSYLVVWSDFRDYVQNAGDIYGARVALDGTILDPSGIAVGTGGSPQENPAVAWNGNDYLVVWADDVNATTTGRDIRGRRVGPDGALLEAEPFDVSTATGQQDMPAVASNGTDYLVAWQDGRTAGTDWDVYAARVDGAGTVLDGTGLMVVEESFNQNRPDIASDGTDYLVAWQDARDGAQFDLFASRVGAGGAVLDGTGFTVSGAAGNQIGPAVTFDGTSYFAAWHDARNGGTSDFDLYGARIGTDGTVLDVGGVAVAAVTGSHQVVPDVAADGNGTVLVTWRDMRSGGFDLYGGRVEAGSPMDGDGFVISAEPGSEGDPTLASHAADTWLVAYNRPVQTSTEGVSTRVRARFIHENAQCAADADCDDANECTTDTCNLITGTCETTAVADGTACTGGVCSGGGCVECLDAGDCDDAVACTVDQCSSGACSNTPDDTACDDSNECTSDVCTTSGCESTAVTDGTACTGGVCSGGACVECIDAGDCDDGVACTSDTCDSTTSTCTHAPDDTACDDGNECTADTCTGTGCDNTAVTDGTACTGGVCSGGSCVECIADSGCDDGIACTVDTCDTATGTCTSMADDTACDDGDVCNGSETCDLASGCQSGTALVCDDGVACTIDGCDASLGCQTTADDTACDDGNECTADTCTSTGCDNTAVTDGTACTGGVCSAGACVECIANSGCDDGIACTVDTCDTATGTCTSMADDTACDDGNECTADTCTSTGCDSTAVPDGTACTGGVCSGGACVECIDASDCDDAVACTVDQCSSGACSNTPDDTACDDGNECTADTCTSTGCDNTAVPDGTACTGGVCSAGACVECIADSGCDDGIACTVDTCDTATGTCTSTADDTACDDGNSCTSNTCDPAGGCQSTTLADGTQCDAGGGATGICSGGTCICTCSSDTDCDDGNVCNGAETCYGDVANGCGWGCEAGTPIDCNDGVACTADSCDPSLGCQNVPDDSLCDDANECTTDACTSTGCENVPVTDGTSCGGGGGVCSGGTCVGCIDDADCDDGVACTTDTCDFGSCTNTPDDTACHDSNECTADTCTSTGCENTPVQDGTNCTGGTCSGGECIMCLDAAGCDDGIGCTIDACEDPTLGCTNTPDDTACDDANECTTDACTRTGCENTPVANGTTCSGGSCVDGVCESVCDPATCDDGDVCNGTETCDSSGTCQSGTPLDCDDGLACTVDTCDPVLGCQNVADDTLCDDFNDCTTDTCTSTGCNSTAVADGTPCLDGTSVCSAGVCATCVDADCDDGVACTLDSCDSNGACTNVPDDSLCNDLNECTVDTCTSTGCENTAVADGTTCMGGCVCSGGSCVGCVSDADCDDGVACTVDTCDTTGCGCDQTPDDTLCDDGNECTTDTCTVTGCENAPVTDGTDCSGGVCVGGSCVPDCDGMCDDGDVCNGIETCDPATGACQSGTPLDCDDGVLCTIDSCDTVMGCQQTADDLVCDDQNECTVDTCTTTGCDNTPVADGTACDGGTNVCVAGTCAPCLDDASCDDGVECTTDVCGSDGCEHTPQHPACDDSNACTVDSCDATSGCVNTAVPDGSTCPGGHCQGAICVDDTTSCDVDADCDDGTVCTIDLCASGTCEHNLVADGTACNGGGVCQDGTCVDCMTDGDCDDGIYCTQDSCDADLTCVHVADDAVCYDARACTVDTCTSTGCDNVWAADGTPCEDGTGHCEGGTCVPGAVCGSDLDCDDGDPCTADGCAADGTCTNVPISGCGEPCSAAADCDDGMPCNGTEVCDADGQCVAGDPPPDGEPCATARICIAGTCERARCGDGFLASNEQCDDGNGTSGDGCDADCTFSCEQDADCIDGDTCTVDRCVDHACEHTPACVDAGGGDASIGDGGAGDGGPGDGAVGSGDALVGSDAGGTGAPERHGGCGCTVPGTPRDVAGGGLLALIVLGWLVRRRRW